LTRHILRQLPFQDAATVLNVMGEQVVIRPYQIAVWVGLSLDSTWPKNGSIFPAILDTGHNHNFSISERLLHQWAGLSLDQLPPLGTILVNKQEVPLLKSAVWIHRNKPKSAELLPHPFALELPHGIAVYPEGTPAPRLPLIGLRGLVTNQLQLMVDGSRRVVSLRT
jgi:hypothetical protein